MLYFWVISVSLLLSGAAGAQDKVLLRYNFSPGEVATYRTTYNADITNAQLPKRENMYFYLFREMGVTQTETVKSVSAADGSFEIAAKCTDSYRVGLESAAIEILDEEDLPAQTVQLAPNGKILKLISQKNAELQRALRSLFGGILDVNCGLVFPEQEVGAGDKWPAVRQESDVKLPFMQTLEYRLEELEGSGDERLARIVLEIPTVDLDSLREEIKAAALQSGVTRFRIGVSQTYWVNVTSGRVERTRFVADYDLAGKAGIMFPGLGLTDDISYTAKLTGFTKLVSLSRLKPPATRKKSAKPPAKMKRKGG